MIPRGQPKVAESLELVSGYVHAKRRTVKLKSDADNEIRVTVERIGM